MIEPQGTLSLRIEAKNEGWESVPVANSRRDCDQRPRAYCLGAITSGSGAQGGFLGRWANLVGPMNRGGNWQSVTDVTTPLIKRIVEPSLDAIQWRGLLMCIMSRALSLSQLKAIKDGKPLLLWEKEAWKKALNKGVTNPWNSDAKGQGMLIAVVCLIHAMIGYDKGPEGPNPTVRNICTNVWDQVKLELQEVPQGSSNRHIKTLDEFLDKLKKDEAGSSLSYPNLGLLLSLYYGLNQCGEYRGNYDLTALVRTSGWELGEMGSCSIDQNTFMCGGGTGQPVGSTLNMWTNRKSSLISGQLKEAPTTTQTKLVTQDSEEDVTKLKQQQRQRNQDFIRQSTNQMEASHRHYSESSVVYGNTPANMQLHRKPGSDGGSKPPAGVSEAEINVRDAGDETKSIKSPRKYEVQKEDNTTRDIINEQGAPEKTAAQKEQKKQQVPVKDPSSPPPDLRSHLPQQTPDGEGLADKSMTQQPSSPPTQSSVGPIVGGIVALFLAIGGVYGIYRVYLRPVSRLKPDSAGTENSKGRVSYGPYIPT
ncbi:hypothetical protein C922_03314 [Plasmodium inui San Antonio 1]|uniref:Uncharacterized protein n=1 Tax=Plasmodium inui San Antonio 1 TaxID=1237626 RepID=W7A520_9APIC|nr:hypothetical protein C922_03314 [Plasmodium inui San Antonio 1]EUD66398.1 hypothetical protein C922_03314 [Plasmodium inui San Antonio 1]